MANQFYRGPIVGADLNTWALFLDQIISDALGGYSSYLFNDSGALKLTPGKIGIIDGTNNGVSILDVETTIDISGLSVSNWGQIEMSVSGTVVTFSASDIAGANDAESLPAGFTSAYDPLKSGFYINPTARTIGIVWKNASGILTGIVNCADKVNGYVGENVTDDANENPIYFNKNLVQKDNKIFQNLTKYTYISSASGIAVTTSWSTFPIDNLIFTNDSNVSVSSNQVNLPAGLYKINAKFYGRQTNTGLTAGCGVRLRDVTNSATKINGSGFESGPIYERHNFTLSLSGIFELTGSAALEFQMKANQNSYFAFSDPFDDHTQDCSIVIERIG